MSVAAQDRRQSSLSGARVSSILGLDGARAAEVLGRRLDAVLGEGARHRRDLAAAADAAPAAHGVDVDAQLARGVEDRRSRPGNGRAAPTA